MLSKKASLTVFVMRHGERLDEALHARGEHVPREIKIDPPLTALGHQQAHAAFARLRQALRDDGRKRKIAVFTSPTQRTMGTSLMLSCTSLGNWNDEGLIKWGMQNLQDTATTNDNNEAANHETSSANPIPICVLNGLGSCAARIVRCGGADAAVRMGYLPCADFPLNDGSPYSPASSLLQDMQKECARGGITEHGNPVQYCKVHPGGWLVPLAPPLTLQSTGQTPVPPFPTIPEHCQPKGSERFWKALDRAVLLAEADGCDTIIVVAHREGVRELLDRWGANGFHLPRRLNYCCIASYRVKVFDDLSCRWCFHGVVDYQDFDANSVPNKERWRQRHCNNPQPEVTRDKPRAQN